MFRNCLLKQCKDPHHFYPFYSLKYYTPVFSWPFEYRVTPFYEIMYLYLIYAAIVTQFGISGTDTLLLDIYLHIGALMKIVAYDLDTLEDRSFGKGA